MAPARGLTERAYVRAIEAAWSEVRGRPVVLSPREFELASGWRRRGVPLAVVLEVIGHQAKRGFGGRGGPRSLSYIAAAIEESWETIASGRLRTSSTPEPAATVDPAAAWRKARESAPTAALESLLSRLITAADRGVPAITLDAELDVLLPAAAPEDLRREAAAAAEKALAPFRSRMSAGELTRTRARAEADRLRAVLGLPRLALRRSDPASSRGFTE